MTASHAISQFEEVYSEGHAEHVGDEMSVTTEKAVWIVSKFTSGRVLEKCSKIDLWRGIFPVKFTFSE